jgi:hypothetical protein
VSLIDYEQRNSDELQKIGKESRGKAQCKLAEAHLDSDLPETDDTCMNKRRRVVDHVTYRRVQRVQSLVDKGDQDIGVEEQSQSSAQRPQQEIFGQWRVEIIRDMQDD